VKLGISNPRGHGTESIWSGYGLSYVCMTTLDSIPSTSDPDHDRYNKVLQVSKGTEGKE
jgi:hypothetical protein